LCNKFVKIGTCGLTNLESSYLSNSHVCFADSDKRVLIDRKVPRLVHPGEYILDARNRPDDYDVRKIQPDPDEVEKIISGSPSVLRNVDPVEVGSGSDEDDFKNYIRRFESGSRDPTVVRVSPRGRQHASQSVAVASTSRQARSEPVASSSCQTSSQPVASTSHQTVPSRQAVPIINRYVSPEEVNGNVLMPKAEDSRQRNTAEIEVCF